MRRLLAGIVAAILALTLAPSASAKASCSVSPAPVVLGGSFTISVSGLTPNANYYNVMITQARDPSNNGHPNWSVETGADGSGTTTVPSTTWSPDGVLTTGSAKVRVYPSSGAMKGTANCSFKIVAP